MDRYDEYAEYTRMRDWDAICRLNNVEPALFTTQKELEALHKYLEQDEVVFALTSGVMCQTGTSNSLDLGFNTWLVVLTSERFLFMDAAMLTDSIDTQSIRYDMVQAVSASQGWMLGKIMVDIGSRVIVVDNCKKSTVKVVADLANKWIRRKGRSEGIMSNRSQSSAPDESPLGKLERLAKLHSMNAISDEEFNEVKKKLLSLL